jgi:hypothetical protein
MTILGKIGSADIGTGTDVLLGTIDEAGTVNIRLCNRNAADVKVRIAIGTGAGPAAGDYIEYDTTLPANEVLEDGGITVSIGEKIWVRSDTANVSARAFGMPAQ